MQAFRRLDGVYLRFGEDLDPDLNRRLHSLGDALLRSPLDGVTDIIPAYTSLYIEFDSHRTSRKRVFAWAEAMRLRAEAVRDEAPPRRVEIPVRYDGDDLAAVSRWSGLSVAEVIERHSGEEYQVYALGFTAGFPFMAEVDERLRMPRRQLPRTRVEANSVAVAGRQTGIYPLPTPGGWHILGHSLQTVFDPNRPDPFLVKAGDKVRFRPATGSPAPEPDHLDLLPLEPRHPRLKVEKPGLLDLVVDEGRFLVGHTGLGRCGALDGASAGLANRLLGNPAPAPVLEMTLSGPCFEVLGDTVLVVTGWALRPVLNGQPLEAHESFAVRQGDRLEFSPGASGSRSYLAITGGFESERFMGSASVDLSSKLGRPLQAGDLLGTAQPRLPRSGYVFRPWHKPPETVTLRLRPGPQADRDTLKALANGIWTVSQANRMGIHFGGPQLEGGEVLSEAVPIGALQITSGGRPILLLNDRGTLGGYSKPALLNPGDLPVAAQLKAGDTVRFKVTARPRT